MEPIKYKTKMSRTGIPIPKHILQRLDEGIEVEVVFRPIRPSSSARPKLGELIKKIEKQMNEEFPNLRGPIGKELANLAGISRDIEGNMRKYTDKEILGMARLKKYLEKEGIIESLF